MSRSLFGCVTGLVLAGLLMVPAGCGRKGESGPDRGVGVQQTRYHCPMHPQIVSNKPGECPICGMALELIATSAAAVPGPRGVAGLVPVVIAPDLRQRMGLTLGHVEQRELKRELRLPARIEADESRQVRVTSKIDGFVESLFVSVTGQSVRKGDPLWAIYSPQVMAAADEYRLAERSGVASLIEASRTRLGAWDLTPEQVAPLSSTNPASRTLILPAPASGIVTEKTLLAGQKIIAGETLMVITDCSTVWARVDVGESDLPLLRLGSAVELSFPNLPDTVFTGTISFLPPGLDPETRTLRVRVIVPNPDLRLKLGMYAEALVRLPLGERVVIPVTAVIQTGTHAYAFRDEGEGKLAPVEIRTGLRAGDFVEVLSGVSTGEAVVTSANFLLDSESSIRAAGQAFGTTTTP